MPRKSKSDINKSRITLLREERGWSQYDLAERVFLPQRTISDIERGLTNNLSNYALLADFFEVSIDYLYNRTDVRNEANATEKRILELLSLYSDEEKEHLLKHIELELVLSGKSTQNI